MIGFFIVSLLLASSVSLFTITYRYNAINRMVINAPITLFEYSVPLVNVETISFSQNELEKRYKEYIDLNIKNYASDYSIDFRYYDPLDDGLVTDNPIAVEIYIKAKIITSFNYERKMFYQIVENR